MTLFRVLNLILKNYQNRVLYYIILFYIKFILFVFNDDDNGNHSKFY